VGNFPQAFSHIALVNSARNLSRAEKPEEQRRSTTAEEVAAQPDDAHPRGAEPR